MLTGRAYAAAQESQAGISLTVANTVTGSVFAKTSAVAYPQATPAKSAPAAFAASASLTSSPMASVAFSRMPAKATLAIGDEGADLKHTRLNSSHHILSHAVLLLPQKKS